MKVIDLLNKLAKGEEVPKEIKIKSYTYTFYHDSYFRYIIGNCNVGIDYDFNIFRILNEEVEILEK